MNSNATAGALNIVYGFSGTVNGLAVSGGGEGTASVNEGTLSANVHTDCNDCPPYTVLGPNILTGIIPAALCIGNVINPFKSTQLIHFTRTVRFDASTTLSAYATYTPDGNGGIEGEFTFMGSVPLPVEVERIEPTVETWIPGATPNTIIGHFVMCWVKNDGSRLCGDVSSEYVADGLNIDQPLFRFITFENTSVTGTELHQKEKIVLFASVGS